ncbi:hypothetical protein MBLNU457_5960t2 [Dothideomycetes sp. NU457]
MPLKARITTPEMTGKRTFASSRDTIKELPGDEPNDVLFSSKFGVRTIELNRPKKLNSLNGSMARKIVPRLQEWEKSQMANIIVMKGAGRAFCAGGDVAALAQDNKTGPEGQQRSKDYFALEYKLDHLIATSPKPYVAFIDGITMGGGVGLSVHAPFRIATEKTVFAMPETTIGFFPDVGASFFLPRMDGRLGSYLALTSEQLKGVNVFYAGIATHYIDSSSLPDLEARLAELNFKDYATLPERLAIINETIEEFTTGLPHDQPLQITSDIRMSMDYCFQPSHSIEEILNELDYTKTAEDSPAEVKKWAAKTEDTIRKRSPLSVKVAMKQLDLGRQWGIARTFQHEQHIASRFMEHPDFIEGVTSLLVKPKKDPKWKLATFDDVTDEIVNEFFAENPTELQLLREGPNANYGDYPHAWIGLPREIEVAAYVRENSVKDQGQVLEHFLNQKNHKMGVREKVQEILNRKTVMDDNRLIWQ